MPRHASLRVVIAAVLAGTLVACETPAPPPMVVAAPPPPPPAPPMLIDYPPPLPPPPAMALSNSIVELGSTYRAVVAASSGISPNFGSPADVAQALQVGSSYERVQLQQGAVAYAAIAALQEPSFVASVREFARTRSTREQIAARLLANPAYVEALPNVDKAAGLAIAALDGTGAQVMRAGYDVKQSAYSIQRQAWARREVPNARARLDLAKSLSEQRVMAIPDDVAALRRATDGQAALSLAGPPVAGPYTGAVSRGLAVATLAAMGMAGDDYMAAIAPLLDDPGSGDCLNMSKLNLYQCLAVSTGHYEDIFCLGEHAMMETGKCMTSAAGAPVPGFVAPIPAAAVAAPTPARATTGRR